MDTIKIQTISEREGGDASINGLNGKEQTLIGKSRCNRHKLEDGSRDALQAAAAARQTITLPSSKERCRSRDQREGKECMKHYLSTFPPHRHTPMGTARFATAFSNCPASRLRTRGVDQDVAAEPTGDNFNHILSGRLMAEQKERRGKGGPCGEMAMEFVHGKQDGWTRGCQQQRPCKVSNLGERRRRGSRARASAQSQRIRGEWLMEGIAPCYSWKTPSTKCEGRSSGRLVTLHAANRIPQQTPSASTPMEAWFQN